MHFNLQFICSDPGACYSVAGLLIHYATYLSVHPDSTMARTAASKVEEEGKEASLSFLTCALAGFWLRERTTSKYIYAIGSSIRVTCTVRVEWHFLASLLHAVCGTPYTYLGLQVSIVYKVTSSQW
jgi:hypothetical protein